jgi:KDO2-lipid IV(A) lauroyltransferase
MKMKTHIFTLKNLHPKNLPIWVIFILLRLLVLLPYPVLIMLGKGLGALLYHLPLKHRYIARCNIRSAFPELSPKEQEKLVRENYKSTLIGLVELPLFWFAGNKRLKKLYKIEGVEHMEHALAMNKGVIMMGGHFTSMLMCGRLLAIDLPYNILVMRAKSAFFESIMQHYREKYYAGIIDSHDIRTMVKTLKNNEICWYSPDHDLGRKGAVFAPFMGIPTATITATARLAKMSGSPIVPINFQRNPGNTGYTLRFLEPWEDFPSGDDVADATRLNQFIEAHVREVPEQYFWLHRRFKTRPEGEPDFYRKADK